MIKTSDGTMTKRLAGKPGDRYPTYGFNRPRSLYNATGGETSINLALLNPALSYNPGRAQISVKRSSGGGDLLSGYDFYETSSTVITFPSGDPLIAGEVVEITLEAVASGIMATAPSPQCYTADAVAGQTTVVADFSWPYNINPTKAIGGCAVYLNGVLQTRGSDFTEVNLGTSNTNRILFVDALTGGENIIILPAYQAIDVSAAQSSFNGQALLGIQNALTAGTQGFVDQSGLITVPNTTIVGRAKIPDLSNDLRASLGIERIMTQSIVQLQTEFGASGEPVYAALNDDRGLIRFVGSWVNANDTRGPSLVVSGTVGDYCEITFYGTGLNVLVGYEGTAIDFRATVDGGTEGSNIFSSNSAILGNRNYCQNQVVVAASGLTVGMHTVKLRQATTTLFRWFGFEVLNATPGNANININPGTGYLSGLKYTNALADSISYKASSYTFTVTSANATVGATYTNNSQTFTVLATIASGTQLVCSGTGAPLASGTLTKALGTGDSTITFSAAAAGMARGGRIVHYLNSDGTVGQAYQAVNAAAATLTSADHTNEEVVRVYNWKEFGASRTAHDDFSYQLDSTARAFTLDDGTTTLVSNHPDVASFGEFITFASLNDFLTLTFVGTGIDVVRKDDGSTSADTFTAYIDGTSVGTLSTTASTATRTVKIASGLAYGAHTLKLERTVGSTNRVGFSQFIVYQPKKPTLPTAALEVADYNILGDFSSTDDGAVIAKLSSGTLAKSCSREFVYVGTWGGLLNLNTTVARCGHFVQTSTVGDSVRLTFFGTGFVIGGPGSGGGSQKFSVTVDTVANATGVSINAVTNDGGGNYTSTETVTGNNWKVKFTGLTLGTHTVIVTMLTGGASGILNFAYLDNITPIHAPKSNLYADLQNTLPVGSCSLMDSRKTSMVKEALPASKAWAQAVGVATTGSTSSTSPVPMPDMSVTIKTSGGPLQMSYSATVNHGSTDGAVFTQLYVNGSAVSPRKWNRFYSGAGYLTSSDTFISVLAPGVHKVDLYWWGTTGTSAIIDIARNLTVREL